MPATSKPILIVLHQETSNPGRVGQELRARGFPLDIRRPRFGDKLPQSMCDHAGAVVFGGPMSANDGDDFIKVETDWFGVPLREEAPVLGICLGSQMLTKYLGGRVFSHPEGQVEIGYYPVKPTREGAALVSPWPEKVYQWHREGHDLPEGAALLAESDEFSCQAFRYGSSAYAIQFHVELTLAMMHHWTVRGAERLTLPGARPRREHFSERAVHDDANRVWLRAFLDRWLASDQHQTSATCEAAAAG